MTPQPSRSFEVTVRLQSPTQRWHVLLLEQDRNVSLEFDDPLALARFLEHLEPEEKPPQRGLR